MRTTVTIDGALLQRARKRAAETGRTLSELVSDGLRIHLANRVPQCTPVDLSVFTGTGLQPGLDLEDKDALLDLLDEDARGED